MRNGRWKMENGKCSFPHKPLLISNHLLYSAWQFAQDSGPPRLPCLTFRYLKLEEVEMNCIHRRIVPAVLLLGPVLTFAAPVHAQNSMTASARPAISVLDSTKEQDGLVGSVRRVKTETARIEIKDGHPVEGAPQLVEITTYGIKGNRIENTSYPLPG